MAKVVVDTETGEVLYPYLDELGREINDPTPMEPPLGYVRQPSLAEQIRDMVRGEKLRMEAEAAGMETFEESDDFDVGDDYDPHSPYENDFDPPLSELVKAGKEVETSAKQKDPVREDPQPKKAEAKTEQDENAEAKKTPPSQEPK